MAKISRVHNDGFLDLRRAVDADDARQAVSVARLLTPEKRAELDRFTVEIEAYGQACGAQEWREALRCLARARTEAIAVGLPDLERLVTYRLFDVVQRHREGMRA